MDAERRRLLILVDTNVGGKGGAETHLWNLLHTLDKDVVEVDVIYFDSDENDHKVLRETPGGVNYYRIPVRKIYSPSSFKYFLEIFRFMRKGRYDCVMSLFESSDILAALLGSLAGIKIRISNRRDTGFRSSSKIRFAYRLINPLFTDFIAVSSAVKDSIVEQGVAKEKIRLIHNSVDPERFETADKKAVRDELGLSQADLLFAMVANLNPVKNHESVISALESLHTDYPNAHLLLAGQGQLEEQLKQQAENSGLSDHIHFLGSRNDVENILAATDVFILASHTEGLSNALLEAMGSRTAVIATRVGGNTEVVEDKKSGLLVGTDADSISRAMRELAGSKAKRDIYAKAGYQRVEDVFSMRSMIQAYMSLFNKGKKASVSVIPTNRSQVSDS